MLARMLVALALALSVSAFFLPIVHLDSAPITGMAAREAGVDPAQPVPSQTMTFSAFELFTGVAVLEELERRGPTEDGMEVKVNGEALRVIIALPFLPAIFLVFSLLVGIRRFAVFAGVLALFGGLPSILAFVTAVLFGMQSFIFGLEVGIAFVGIGLSGLCAAGGAVRAFMKPEPPRVAPPAAASA